MLALPAREYHCECWPHQTIEVSRETFHHTTSSLLIRPVLDREFWGAIARAIARASLSRMGFFACPSYCSSNSSGNSWRYYPGNCSSNSSGNHSCLESTLTRAIALTDTRDPALTGAIARATLSRKIFESNDCSGKRKGSSCLESNACPNNCSSNSSLEHLSRTGLLVFYAPWNMFDLWPIWLLVTYILVFCLNVLGHYRRHYLKFK